MLPHNVNEDLHLSMKSLAFRCKTKLRTNGLYYHLRMRSPAVDAKTIGKVIFVLAVSTIGGFFALMNGIYGALGVSAAFEGHQPLSSGALVYWALLLISVLCTGAVVKTWMLLLRRKRPAPLK